MADRVAVGRIISGHGDSRVIIEAGTRFNTDTLKISDADVRRLEQRGLLRRPRDPTLPARPAPAAVAAIEEEAAEVKAPGDGEVTRHDPDLGEGEGAEARPTGGRGRRRQTSDLDL